MTPEELATACRNIRPEDITEVASSDRPSLDRPAFTVEQEARIREIIREEVAAIDQEKFDRALIALKNTPYEPIPYSAAWLANRSGTSAEPQGQSDD